jgi:hypothetical protein
METVAEGIAAPVASVTKPVMELVIVWPVMSGCSAGTNSKKAAKIMRVG